MGASKPRVITHPRSSSGFERDVLGHPGTDHPTVFEVVNETTLSGIARVLSRGQGPVAVLNFASAKNPGGGFLNGSHAQEESLARSSALHASQMRAWDFYERHRASSSLLYSDAMILSPGCPIFRDDDGTLLDEPQMATFITSAAPNAGAAADNRPDELPSIPACSAALGVCAGAGGVAGLQATGAGAWGCGVFRNDPGVVAESFAAHLRHGRWSGRFDRVVFSVSGHITLPGDPRGVPERVESCRIAEVDELRTRSFRPGVEACPSGRWRLHGHQSLGKAFLDHIFSRPNGG